MKTVKLLTYINAHTMMTIMFKFQWVLMTEMMMMKVKINMKMLVKNYTVVDKSNNFYIRIKYTIQIIVNSPVYFQIEVQI